MGVKALILGLSKSKTAWGGVGQWLLTLVLAVLASDQPHYLWLGVDSNTPLAIPLNVPTLFAVGSALLGLVLWGRQSARGPLGEAGAENARQLLAQAENIQRYIGQGVPESTQTKCDAPLLELGEKVDAQMVALRREQGVANRDAAPVFGGIVRAWAAAASAPIPEIKPEGGSHA